MLLYKGPQGHKMATQDDATSAELDSGANLYADNATAMVDREFASKAMVFLKATTKKSQDPDDILPQEAGHDVDLSPFYVFASFFPEFLGFKRAGVCPSLSTCLMLRPHSCSRRRDPSCPLIEAKCAGVRPLLAACPMSQPHSCSM